MRPLTLVRATVRYARNARTAPETRESLQDRAVKTVWIYVDASKDVGDSRPSEGRCQRGGRREMVCGKRSRGRGVRVPRHRSWRGMICLALSFACRFQI